MSYVRLDIDVKEVDAGASDTLADIHGRCFSYPWNAETFQTFLKNSVHRAYIAHTPDAGDVPVGFVLVRTIARESEILSIAVNSEQRGRGVASGLLYRICETLKSERVGKIFLEVGRENNAAIALYQKLGFAPVGDRKAYYQNRGGEDRMNAIIMAKSV